MKIMVAAIQQHLGIQTAPDAEVKTFSKTTHVNQLADAIDEAEASVLGKEASGPQSAADTSR